MPDKQNVLVFSENEKKEIASVQSLTSKIIDDLEPFHITTLCGLKKKLENALMEVNIEIELQNIQKK